MVCTLVLHLIYLKPWAFIRSSTVVGLSCNRKNTHTIMYIKIIKASVESVCDSYVVFCNSSEILEVSEQEV